jgi:hypothetical protein
MTREPCLRGGLLSIRQQGHDPSPLQVANDAAVARRRKSLSRP